jgi:hypothetical protein
MQLRYEWRVWAGGLDAMAARIEGAAAPEDARSSAETYVVTRTTIAVNPKIRDGLLDVKVLRGTSHGFEQWEPLTKHRFPVPADPVVQDLLERLGVRTQPHDRAALTFAELIEEVIGPSAMLAAVDVRKDRRLFTLDDCIVELAEVSIAGSATESAAIESADLESLRSTAGSLGFTAAPNVSYPKMIHRVLGWLDREE